MIAARTRVSGLCLYSRTIFLRVKPTGEWWGHSFSMALSVLQEEQQLKERKKPSKAEKKEKGQSEFGEDIWSHWCHILSDRTGVICRPCSRFDAFVYHCDDECVQFFIIDNCQALCNTNLHTKYNKFLNCWYFFKSKIIVWTLKFGDISFLCVSWGEMGPRKKCFL